MILKVKKLLLHRIDELNYQDLSRSPIITSITKAGIAQLVEHNLAKVGVVGSNPISRSLFCPDGGIGRHAGLKILWTL